MGRRENDSWMKLSIDPPFFYVVRQKVSKINRVNIQTHPSPVPHWHDSIPNFCYSKNEICYSKNEIRYSKNVFLHVFAIAKNFCYSNFFLCCSKNRVLSEETDGFCSWMKWKRFVTKSHQRRNSFLFHVLHAPFIEIVDRLACSPRLNRVTRHIWGMHFPWGKGDFCLEIHLFGGKSLL